MRPLPLSLALSAALLTLAPTGAHAQVVDPTIAEFDPSPDHNAMLSDGSPVVTRYDLEFYLVGAAGPFQVESLGKPSPQVDGKIRVALGSVLTAYPSPGMEYVATVAAVGPAGSARSGVSNTFTFSPCSYTVDPTSQAVAAAGGSATAAVTVRTGCAWTAVSHATWISITSGESGTGSGTVAYTIPANAMTTGRSGTLTIAGLTVTVTQAPACSYTVSPTTQTMAATGGSGTVSVISNPGCSWNAMSNTPWLSLAGGSTGTGNGTVDYTAAENTSTTQRTGTLTVAGQTVTVAQSGACVFTVSPTTVTIAAAGGTGTVTVTTTTGCSWTATSAAGWLAVSPSSGSGSATLTYTVASSSEPATRTGTMTIAGQTVTVTQSSRAPAPPSNLRIIPGAAP